MRRRRVVTVQPPYKTRPQDKRDITVGDDGVTCVRDVI